MELKKVSLRIDREEPWLKNVIHLKKITSFDYFKNLLDSILNAKDSKLEEIVKPRAKKDFYRLEFEVSRDDYDKLERKAKGLGVTVSNLLREYLRYNHK